MPRMVLAVLPVTLLSCHAHGMMITKSDTPPSTADLLVAFDTTAEGSQHFFPMVRGGGTSGVGGGETAFGQTFRFDTAVLLDKITFEVRVTQDVSGTPLLLWFGTGYTGQINSGLSSLLIAPESDLPTGMGSSGDIWYLTLDIVDQSLMPNHVYAFMPRFASGGGGGVHPEMEVGFMGTYCYEDGAAFTFDGGFGYNTILNNEMAFFLHGGFIATLAGDFDGNGDVDGDDFLAWQTGFGIHAGAQESDGDYDNDGDVDGDDFLGWQADFGSDSGSSSSAVVPEPASMALVLVMAVAGMLAHRVESCRLLC